MVHEVKRNSHYSFILMLSLLLMHTSAHTAELVLQSIDNLDNDEFHTDEGNYSCNLILGYNDKNSFVQDYA